MSRTFDFSAKERETILARYGYVCAACGCDDEEIMEADHWQAGSKDAGVCLCRVCNRNKSNHKLPGKPLPVRPAVEAITHQEYKLRVRENRAAFNQWANLYRGTARKKAIAFKATW